MTRAATIRHPVFRCYVFGPGDFPFDMLRYDRAYPVLESDTGNFADHWGGITISVIVIEALSITVDRWRSFGWGVAYWADDIPEPYRSTVTKEQRWAVEGEF